MIKMKAEAVIITKPDANTNLNGTNINMNGKVLLADVIDKGYKGAGILSGDVVLCTAEGNRETKAAETAMNILSQHVSRIKASGDAFKAEADAFFNHAFRELSIKTGDFESFSATLIYNHADSVYIANTGDNAVYTFDGIYLDQIDFGNEEEKEADKLPTSDIVCRTVSNIRPDTQIIVLSKEIYEYTTDEQILDILTNAVSTKQACQKLVDKASENGAESCVSVLIENLTPVDIPTVADNNSSDIADDEGEDEDIGEEDNTKPSKLPLIILIILLIIIATVTGVFLANQKYGFIDKMMEKRTTEPPISSTEPSANMVTIPTNSSALTSITTVPSTSAVSTSTTRSTTTTRNSSSGNNNSSSGNSSNERPVYNPNGGNSNNDEPTAAPSTDAPSTDAPTSETPPPVTDDEPSNDDPSNEDPDNSNADDDTNNSSDDLEDR